MTDDAASPLLVGPRGRRLCLEYARQMSSDVHEPLFWLAHRADPSPGTLIRFTSDGDEGDEDAEYEDPDPSTADLVARLRTVDTATIDAAALRAALQASVDTAMYWQEPDGTDVIASHPDVIAALDPIAELIMASEATRGWDAPRGAEQWAVDWRSPDDRAPLPSDSRALLTAWSEQRRAEEVRAGLERPADPYARWSGTWWSVPTELLLTRGVIADALELVEDSMGWEEATIIPVRGSGRTLEIRTDEDWAQLCRQYPLEVTASTRHDWFRVTGRDGRWLIPDWARVAGGWDAVHLSTLAYLRCATTLIEIDDEYASVIGGWAPDSTIWLTDGAREWDEPRQHWARPQNADEWTRQDGSNGGVTTAANRPGV